MILFMSNALWRRYVTEPLVCSTCLHHRGWSKKTIYILYAMIYVNVFSSFFPTEYHPAPLRTATTKNQDMSVGSAMESFALSSEERGNLKWVASKKSTAIHETALTSLTTDLFEFWFQQGLWLVYCSFFPVSSLKVRNFCHHQIMPITLEWVTATGERRIRKAILPSQCLHWGALVSGIGPATFGDG